MGYSKSSQFSGEETVPLCLDIVVLKLVNQKDSASLKCSFYPVQLTCYQLTTTNKLFITNTTFLRCVAAIKYKTTSIRHKHFIIYNHLLRLLCAIVNKICIYEICKPLNSVS